MVRGAQGPSAEGRLDAEGLRAIEHEAVVKAVRMQEEVGLLGVTDGEYSRTTWHMDYLYAHRAG